MNSIPIHGLSAITAPFGHDRTPIHDFRLATAYRIVVVQWRSSIAAACHYRLFKSCRLIVIRRNKMKKIRFPMWIVMEMVRAHCAAADLKCCILLWQVTQIFDVNFFPNHFLLVFFFFNTNVFRSYSYQYLINLHIYMGHLLIKTRNVKGSYQMTESKVEPIMVAQHSYLNLCTSQTPLVEILLKSVKQEI